MKFHNFIFSYFYRSIRYAPFYRSIRYATALFVFLALLGCQRVTGEDEPLSFEEQDVILAVEDVSLPIQWVEAGFLSEQQSFSYTFKYNNYLLNLLDTPVENSAGFGPRFEVQGGAEIKGYTIRSGANDLAEIQFIGEHRVSRTSVLEGDCSIQRAVAEFFKEALVLELKLCPGDDEDRGEEALKALFDELSFEVVK